MADITFQPYTTGISGSEGNRLGSIDPRLSRTNYFDGQLLKASDLTRDQIYLDERLLELGQVVGCGIAQGLDVTLVQNRTLRVSPGIAIAPSGRVLQITDKTLEIDLQDSGTIATLNQGLYRRFNRGLYAIAIKFAQVVDGVQESYPADLASRRRPQVSKYAEGVEVALLPLNITLERGDEIAIRAALAQQLITHDSRFLLPTDDAVALGLIAIDNARPLWVDMGLLRRPLRRPNAENALQLDLATHYQELFADIMQARRQGGRADDFAATHYFRLLPPYGPLPKGAIDPVNGRQSFFPKDFDVAIAPVRQSDLAVILEESAHLPPIDLSRDADADIMVLVPMSDQAFALRARQLEASAEIKSKDGDINNPRKTVLRLNSLALRLFRQPPAHLIDIDADAWKAIWAEDNAQQLIYLRRPPRTAETSVSAVVLARGFALGEPGVALPADLANIDIELDKALEQNLALQTTLTEREKSLDTLQKKIAQLESSLGNDADLNAALATIHDLNVEVETLKAQIETLTPQAQDAAVLKTALAAAAEKIDRLGRELDAANQKLADVQSTPAVSDETLQQKLKELAAALDDANSKLATQTEDNEKLRIKIADYEKKLKTLTADVERLQKERDALAGNANSSGTDLAAANAEIVKLNARIDALKSAQAAAKNQLEEAEKARTNAEAEARTATASLSGALAQAQSAQTALATAQQQLDSEKAASTSLRTQLDDSNSTVANLRVQLASRPALTSLFSLVTLATLRGGDAKVAERLEKELGESSTERGALITLLALFPAQTDELLWPSLLEITEVSPKNLQAALKLTSAALRKKLAPATVFANSGEELGLKNPDLLTGWKRLNG